MATQDGKISVLIQELKSSFKTEGGKWLFASIVGLLSLFCSQITQSVKMALNSADFRSQQYESVGMDALSLSLSISCARFRWGFRHGYKFGFYSL
jgi:hypothetical protein